MEGNVKQGIQYKIEGRTVTATINNCSNDIVNLIRKWLGGKLPHWLDTEDFKLPDTVYASVTCHESDEFSEEIGKELAKCRVLDKYNKLLESVYFDFIEDYSKVANKIEYNMATMIRKRNKVQFSRKRKLKRF